MTLWNNMDVCIIVWPFDLYIIIRIFIGSALKVDSVIIQHRFTRILPTSLPTVKDIPYV